MLNILQGNDQVLKTKKKMKERPFTEAKRPKKKSTREIEEDFFSFSDEEEVNLEEENIQNFHSKFDLKTPKMNCFLHCSRCGMDNHFSHSCFSEFDVYGNEIEFDSSFQSEF